MSDLAKMIQRYYNQKLYTAQMVKEFYDKGKITKDEYNTIIKK